MPDKELYEFDSFRLDPEEHLLLRQGEVVPLEPKVFETLVALVERGGRLVGKEELMKAVWPDSFVEESNLTRNISVLRKALYRDDGGPPYIETVPKRGYRFVGEVRALSGEQSELVLQTAKVSFVVEEEESDGEAEGQSAVPSRRGAVDATTHIADAGIARPTFGAASRANDVKRYRLAAAAALLVLTVGGAVVYYSSRSNATDERAGVAAIDSIAVLPFDNEGGDADAEYLSDGMAESLINSLSQLPQLSVKARTSAFRYKGRDISPQVVGKELGVRAVLIGRLAQRGERLALSLELVDAHTENVIWGERYDRARAEVVSLQSEIARDISGKLRAHLSNADERRVAKTYTADPEAYQLYLQGLYHLNKRTAADIRKSMALFQQATDKDPAYAQAFAGLASAYIILTDYSQGMTRQAFKELDLKWRAAVRRAQELDDSLPEVHAQLAAMHEDTWDFAAAEKAYRRAIELNPNSAMAYHWYSTLLGGQGRNEEAFAAINRARDLDPFSVSIAFNVGARFFNARRFDEAVAQFRKVLEMEPNHALTHAILAQTYEFKGMYPEAVAEWRVADVLLEKESAENAERKAEVLTQALKAGGAQGYWRKRLEVSQKEYEEGHGSATNVAVCYAMLGDRDRAFQQLEKSFAAREHRLAWIKGNPAFDRLSADPRFQDLLRRIGLPS